MAAIDKIYVSKYGDYKLFVDWCAKQPKIKDKYGKEVSLMSYVFKYDKWEGVNCRAVIFGTPYYIDAYLIRNCPFDFIQDELMLNYGKKSQEMIDIAYDTVMKRGGDKAEEGMYWWLSKDDFKVVDGVITMDQGDTDYDLIKNGKLYATPQTSKIYTKGTNFKMIQRPYNLFNTPFKCKRWWVSVTPPEDLGYMWYYNSTDTWDFTDEFVAGDGASTHCTKYKTIKAIKRAIRRWNLPVGSIVECTGRYVGDTYKFEIY